tara:strand:+ start:517 stop:747 length:231 start_codon:yes stop_codon:yes gene_type:complete
MSYSLIRKYAIDRNEAPALSQSQVRAEANLGLQLESLLKAWADLGHDCTNKNDWNNFAKYVLNEIQEINQVLKEVK